MTLDTGTLTVRHQLQNIDGKLQTIPPKSLRSRRTLKLSAVSIAALRRQRASQNQDRLLAGGDWVNSGFMFTTRRGTPIAAASVTRAFQRALAEAGLPRMRFHDLRHTCATLLLSQGVPLKVVSEQLGHSQMSLTADTYSHVTPGMQADAAAKMDAVFGSSTSA